MCLFFNKFKQRIVSLLSLLTCEYKNMKNLPLIVKILICVVVCLAIGGLSGIATTDAIPNWYANVNKPSFNPPNWLFAPVWTALYSMMGVAAALVWHNKDAKSGVKAALIIFAVQLLLNGLWSLLFFGMQNPPLAFVEIVILWIAIVLCIRAFLPISKVAGYLLIPYLLWVSFASVLNLSIWLLN